MAKDGYTNINGKYNTIGGGEPPKPHPLLKKMQAATGKYKLAYTKAQLTKAAAESLDPGIMSLIRAICSILPSLYSSAETDLADMDFIVNFAQPHGCVHPVVGVTMKEPIVGKFVLEYHVNVESFETTWVFSANSVDATDRVDYNEQPSIKDATKAPAREQRRIEL